MKIILSVLVVASALSLALAGDLRELFTLDCDGNAVVTKNLGLTKTTVSLSPAIRGYKATLDIFRERVKCKCPSISDEEFMRLFAPSVEWSLNYAKGPRADISAPNCDLSSFVNSSIVGFKAGPTAGTYVPKSGVEFVLPSTCNYDSWKNSGTCKASLVPGNMGVELQLAVKRCPNSAMPALSITCKGANCDKMAMPCGSDSQCGAMKCKSFTRTTYNSQTQQYEAVGVIGDAAQMASLFYDLSITTGTTLPSCLDPSAILGSLYEFAHRYWQPTGTVAPHTELKLCLPESIPTGDRIRDPELQAAFGYNTGCRNEYFTTCYNSTCYNQFPNGTGYSSPCQNCYNTTTLIDCVTPVTPWLRPWNGLLDDGTDALADSRVAGIAPRIPAPLTAGASVVFYADCEHALSFLPGSPVLPISLSIKSLSAIYNKVWGLFKTATDCATPVSDQAFRVAKGVTLDNILYELTSPKPADLNFGAARRWSIAGSGTGRLNIPATCTYDYWNTNGVCSLQYTGLSGLFAADVTINARARKCPGPYSQPEIYVECVGAGCSLVSGVRPCSADSECSGGLKCQDINAMFDITTDSFADIYWPEIYTQVWFNNTYNRVLEAAPAGTCRDAAFMRNDIRRYLLAGTGNNPFATTNKVCMHDAAHFKNILSTWGNGEVSAVDGVTTMPNLKAWTAPSGNVLSYTRVPEVVLTFSVSASTQPTAAQLAAIAANIAAVFNVDASLVRVIVASSAKKRATYSLVAEFFTPQVKSDIQAVSSNTNLQNQLTAAVSQATASSITVSGSIAASVPPPPPLADDGNGAGASPTATPGQNSGQAPKAGVTNASASSAVVGLLLIAVATIFAISW